MLGPQADFSMLLFKIEMHGHSIAKLKFPSGILSNPSLMEFGNASRPKVFPSIDLSINHDVTTRLPESSTRR